jgi:serine/threonine protein kinase
LSKEKTIEKLTNELYKIKSKLNKLEKDSEIPLTISYQKEEKNFQKRYQKTQKEIEKNDSEIANLEDKLSIEKKVNQLLHIVQGLKDIHQKNLVHRDFHTGNILKGIEQTSCLITDLGLCKTVDQITREEKIFGVLPYVAPEVLQGQPYTQAADIYS